jgi:hypothetical protein
VLDALQFCEFKCVSEGEGNVMLSFLCCISFCCLWFLLTVGCLFCLTDPCLVHEACHGLFGGVMFLLSCYGYSSGNLVYPVRVFSFVSFVFLLFFLLSEKSPAMLRNGFLSDLRVLSRKLMRLVFRRRYDGYVLVFACSCR